MMRIHLMTCCLLLASHVAMADWSGDAELGFLVLTGNSDSNTLNAKLDVRNDFEPWLYNIHLETVNSSQNGNRTAEKYLASSQLDYVINADSYAFVFGSYDNNRFSGFDFQSTAALGYGYQPIKNDAMSLALESAPGYRLNKRGDGSTEEDLIIRLAEDYFWNFSEDARFDQSLNAEVGEDNTIARFQVSVKSRLIGSLSLKVSYGIKYTENVPTNRKQTDTETAVTLVYSF